jgi:predicted Zn-dependent protease
LSKDEDSRGMTLDSANGHRLQAAIGYWELGLAEDALRELEEIPFHVQQHPEILQLRQAILMEREQWSEALQMAETLCQLHPEETDHWIKIGFCLHELKRTSEAKERLLTGPPALRESAIFYYNLACYECQLGQIQAAWLLLERAVQLDATFQILAKTDSDLAPLWDKEGEKTP